MKQLQQRLQWSEFEPAELPTFALVICPTDATNEEHLLSRLQIALWVTRGVLVMTTIHDQ